MNKYKVGDTVVWDGPSISKSHKTAVIDKVDNLNYYYTFFGGEKWHFDILNLDRYEGVRLLTPLEKLL